MEGELWGGSRASAADARPRVPADARARRGGELDRRRGGELAGIARSAPRGFAKPDGHTSELAPRPGRRERTPQHRVHPHRLPVDAPAALHAPRAGDAARLPDVQRLLRFGLAVLSVALVDL